MYLFKQRQNDLENDVKRPAICINVVVLASSKLKLSISASKNQKNIFTVKPYYIYAHILKVWDWFFHALVVNFTNENVKCMIFDQNMHFPPFFRQRYDVIVTTSFEFFSSFEPLII